MRSVDALPLRVASEQLVLLPPGVVWWQGARTLIAADLHLGLEEVDTASLAARHERDLTDLRELASARGAQRLIVLGDFLDESVDVTPDLVDRIGDWRERLGIPVWLTPGNHDVAIAAAPAAWPFDRVTDGFTENGFFFTHLPARPDSAPTPPGAFRICGHLHPVVRLEGGRREVQLRCFAKDPDQLILPSFGRMTRGAPVEDARARKRYPVTGEGVLDLSL